MEKIHNCVIIGSGPAGYSSAIYAARAGLYPILFSGFQPGGQLTTTSMIDNYLGFPKGISGNDFMDNCRKQAKRFNTKIINKSVTKVSFSTEKKGIHYIFLNKESIIKSIGVIIATGSSPKFLGIDNEKRLIGLGISFCATCDGFFHRNKDIAVVGGGDSALEEANYLSNICRKVYLLVRKDYLRASKILQNRIFSKKNIYILYNSNVIEIIGNDFLESIKILNNKNKTKNIISISGLFIAIGHIPNTSIFKNELELNKNGYIITKKGRTMTNKPGIFAAGDVQDYIYRQAITSAGSGCMAALDLERYLSS
ncbi:thioredoxin-disulfide reductase [Blattabacterium cuenoti]|uniref:thioredoxin-disulfide reductase n=1 Tax=Blattabacterium cuenoti TaxID=1653831 RepID=UPI00163BA94D|nr:thioredoxin-disulfide reductase [Blattabacterium cuenoti]